MYPHNCVIHPLFILPTQLYTPICEVHSVLIRFFTQKPTSQVRLSAIMYLFAHVDILLETAVGMLAYKMQVLKVYESHVYNYSSDKSVIIIINIFLLVVNQLSMIYEKPEVHIHTHTSRIVQQKSFMAIGPGRQQRT